MPLTQVDQGLLGQYAQYTGFKNRIINGAMMIAQRGTSFTQTTNNQYGLDRFDCTGTVGSKLSFAQSSVAPAGFINSTLITSLSAYSVLSGDLFIYRQRIEGLNCADLAWGTANAATVTLSFWVQSSLTGTFGGYVINSAGNRSYPFSYTISAANTWEKKSVTIAGDTTGTWLTTNGIGMEVGFSLGVGSTFAGAAGSWAGASYFGAVGQVNLVGTNGATFYITGVQLEKGSTATSFDYRPYGTELALCQRYYWRNNALGAYSQLGFFGVAGSTTQVIGYPMLPAVMRASPTVNSSNARLADGANGVTFSAISVSFAGTLTPELTFTVSGATQYRPYYVQANNNASAWIDYSAEL